MGEENHDFDLYTVMKCATIEWQERLELILSVGSAKEMSEAEEEAEDMMQGLEETILGEAVPVNLKEYYGKWKEEMMGSLVACRKKLQQQQQQQPQLRTFDRSSQRANRRRKGRQ